MEFFFQLGQNQILWTALLGWFVAQALKVVFVFISQNRLDFRRLVGSGGMPSSHSSFVTSASVMVGLTQGFDSMLFAMCFVLSCVVTYDAAGVRRASGQQAKILNQIVEHWDDKPDIQGKRLKELLGHTPFEVIAGIFLGIAIALIMYFFVYNI